MQCRGTQQHAKQVVTEENVVLDVAAGGLPGGVFHSWTLMHHVHALSYSVTAD